MGICTKMHATHAPASAILIRLIVGSKFLFEGIQKFLFADELCVGRFVKIGIPHPELMAPFVVGATSWRTKYDSLQEFCHVRE